MHKFNSGIAMASLQMKNAAVRNGPPGAFKIQGVMHRKLGPMLNHHNQ